MIEFKTVNTLLNAAINLNEGDAWLFAVDNGVKTQIIKLNTIDQLFDKGIDSLNKTLGKYSNVTIGIKKSKGQKTSNITLKDTGDFYKTFRVDVTKTEIKIFANPLKDQDNLFDKYGANIVGLTEENRLLISEMILQNIIIYVRYLNYNPNLLISNDVTLTIVKYRYTRGLIG